MNKNVAWKIIIDDKYIYVERNSAMANFFNKNSHREMLIYSRSKISGWDLVADYKPSEICKCGRRYDYSEDGNPVRIYPFFQFTKKIVEVTELILLTPQCSICYYSAEHNAGRFCPRWVKERL